MTESFPGAAQRHFEDAELLRRETRLDCAGYHYGISGECAIKAVCVEESGSRPRHHFGADTTRDLRVSAALNLTGRKGQRLCREIPALFTDWSIDSRYAGTGYTSNEQVERWRADARRVLNLMQGL